MRDAAEGATEWVAFGAMPSEPAERNAGRAPRGFLEEEALEDCPMQDGDLCRSSRSDKAGTRNCIVSLPIVPSRNPLQAGRIRFGIANDSIRSARRTCFHKA